MAFNDELRETRPFFFAIALIAGCQGLDNSKTTSTPTTELTTEQKEVARQEISARIDEIIRGPTSLMLRQPQNPIPAIRALDLSTLTVQLWTFRL